MRPPPLAPLAPLRAFFEKPVVLSALTSWILAQLLKTMIVLLSGHKKSPKELLEIIIWRTGGMPSSHAALVSGLAASVAITNGPGSTLFAVCFFFAMVVMRDAMGVRRSSGLQARALNLLGRHASDRLGLDYHPVKEIQGHTPLEVVVGALLGVFIACAYAWL